MSNHEAGVFLSEAKAGEVEGGIGDVVPSVKTFASLVERGFRWAGEFVILAVAPFDCVGLWVDGDGTVGVHKVDLHETHAPEVVERWGYRYAENTQRLG